MGSITFMEQQDITSISVSPIQLCFHNNFVKLTSVSNQLVKLSGTTTIKSSHFLELGLLCCQNPFFICFTGEVMLKKVLHYEIWIERPLYSKDKVGSDVLHFFSH